MEKELTEKEALEAIKKLVYTGVKYNGSLTDIDKHKSTVENLFKVVEDALDLKQKSDGK